MPPDDWATMRESVQDQGFTDPVIWTYQGSVLDGWHRYTIANLLGLELEVREYDGDPVQWVIGRNAHRRHLTEVQRASCVSAAINWATQGKRPVMHTERDDSGHFSPTGAMLAPVGETDSTSLTQDGSGESQQESFFTQSERASLADVSVRTQKRSDSYEKAGLGPEIRSGAISGAEAERRVRGPDAPKPKRKVRDPDAPKPPSRLQQLEMKLEAKTLECQTDHLPAIDALQRELREAKAQVSEYPHEREVVANEREVIISTQTSASLSFKPN